MGEDLPSIYVIQPPFIEPVGFGLSHRVEGLGTGRGKSSAALDQNGFEISQASGGFFVNQESASDIKPCSIKNGSGRVQSEGAGNGVTLRRKLFGGGFK